MRPPSDDVGEGHEEVFFGGLCLLCEVSFGGKRLYAGSCMSLSKDEGGRDKREKGRAKREGYSVVVVLV